MKKITIKNVVLFLGLIILSSSCLKTKECGECYTPPGSVYFKVVDSDSGDNLYNNSTYSEQDLNLYFLENNVKVYIDVSLYEYTNQRIINTQDMSNRAIKDTGETFYLELSPQDTDTIYLKVVSVLEHCCTFHIIDQLTVNGDEPEIDLNDFTILIKK